MADSTKYRLTLSENQARIVMMALESFFRVRLGQYFDLVEDIAFNGYDHDKDKGGTDFKQRINDRNDAEELFNKAFEMAKPKYRSANEYYQQDKYPRKIKCCGLCEVIGFSSRGL